MAKKIENGVKMKLANGGHQYQSSENQPLAEISLSEIENKHQSLANWRQRQAAAAFSIASSAVGEISISAGWRWQQPASAAGVSGG